MAKVYLIANTPNPEKVIAAQQLNMSGRMVKNINEIEDDDAKKFTQDVFKSYLMGSLEFIDFVWNIEDVTRAFTHQLIRYRIGTSFSQESLRFVKKSGFDYLTGPSIQDAAAIRMYDNTMSLIRLVYNDLLDMGVEMQDARGLLPTNIMTKIGFKCTYRSLYNIAETRLCLQAQEQEWQDVMKQMKKLISDVSPILADNLQPKCYHSGFCEYGGSMDRPCVLQSKYPKRK